MINSIFNEQLRNGRLLLQRCQWQCAHLYNYFDFNYFNEFVCGKSFSFHFDSHPFHSFFLSCSHSLLFSAIAVESLCFKSFDLCASATKANQSHVAYWQQRKNHRETAPKRKRGFTHNFAPCISIRNVPQNIFTKRLFSFFIARYGK